MLLRRITQHVKEQNWFAVGIDLVVVVVGIFLGIQVANWNEGRLAQEESSTYIERVRQDLDENYRDIMQRKRYFEQVQQHAIAALSTLNDPDATLGQQFLIDIYQASQIMPRGFGRDTYDEILSVGALSSFEDTLIKKRISNYYRSIQAAIANIQADSPYRDLVRAVMPIDVQRAIRGSCDDIIKTGDNLEPILTLPESCPVTFEPSTIARALDLIQKEDFSRALTQRISQLDTVLSAANVILVRTDMIDNYLSSVQ